ncbi:MAG: MFS transporter [Candidatus Omnitrophica bacterium]|nr:MFS transporter [Candidatus Omnitrophota bacterium]
MEQAKEKSTHHITAQKDRIPIFQKFIYSMGSLGNDSQAAWIGQMVIILILGLGINPLWVGLIGCIPRIFDAILDPIVGYSSDNTRTRYGRRRPFIFFGAIGAGICYALMFQLYRHNGPTFNSWYFLIFQIIFFVAFTCYSIPWIALGYEMTPDHHERTSLQSWSRVFAQVPWLLAPWCWAIMYSFKDPETGNADPVLGARIVSIIIGLVIIGCGILPAIFNKEHFADLPKPERKNPVKNLFKGIVTTFKNKLFVKICAVTFLIFNGFMLSSTFIAFVIFFYVFQNAPSTDVAYAAGGKLLGIYGTFSAICTVCIVSGIPWLSKKLGKRNAFFVTIPISIIGYAMKWVGYNQTHPANSELWQLFDGHGFFNFLKICALVVREHYLLLACAPFIVFGLGSLFTIILSMVADVCDIDELKTGERREGIFSAVYWWTVKLGLALASLIGGALLVWTGFKQELGIAQAADTLLWMRILDVCIPIVTSIVAIFIIRTIGLTAAKAYDIRMQVERRREERRKEERRTIERRGEERRGEERRGEEKS